MECVVYNSCGQGLMVEWFQICVIKINTTSTQELIQHIQWDV